MKITIETKTEKVWGAGSAIKHNTAAMLHLEEDES